MMLHYKDVYGKKERCKLQHVNKWDCRPSSRRIIDPDKARTLRENLCIIAVPEITVGHWPFSEQNHILTDYLEACSVKRPTSSKTVGKSSQIKNQASYNRCHIKLIAYLTAVQCPSDDGGP